MGKYRIHQDFAVTLQDPQMPQQRKPHADRNFQKDKADFRPSFSGPQGHEKEKDCQMHERRGRKGQDLPVHRIGFNDY